MKFSIALIDLEKLLKAVLHSRGLKSQSIVLSACVARIFVAGKEGVAGAEAIVLADGEVTISAKSFRDVLKTYKGTRVLVFEGSAEGLRIQNFRMPVLSYNRAPKPPADFQVIHTSPPPGAAGAADRR